MLLVYEWFGHKISETDRDIFCPLQVTHKNEWVHTAMENVSNSHVSGRLYNICCLKHAQKKYKLRKSSGWRHFTSARDNFCPLGSSEISTLQADDVTYDLELTVKKKSYLARKSRDWFRSTMESAKYGEWKYFACIILPTERSVQQNDRYCNLPITLLNREFKCQLLSKIVGNSNLVWF